MKHIANVIVYVKHIAALTSELKEKDSIIQDLENKIIDLQDKATYHGNRITSLEDKLINKPAYNDTKKQWMDSRCLHRE